MMGPGMYGLIQNLGISSDRVATSCGTHRLGIVIATATDALQWHTWHTATRGKTRATVTTTSTTHIHTCCVSVVSCKLYCVDLQMTAIYIMCYVVSTVLCCIYCVMLYAVCYVI